MRAWLSRSSVMSLSMSARGSRRRRVALATRVTVCQYRRTGVARNSPAGRQGTTVPPGWRVSGGVAGCLDPQGFLSREERGALGLVLFGGLGYVQASHEVAISPLDTAALLRAVLHRLAAPSGTSGLAGDWIGTQRNAVELMVPARRTSRGTAGG